MKQKSLPLTLLLYFFRLIPLRFCNFRGGASRREVLLSLPLLVLWFGILYVVALCFQDSLPAFIPPASIPYILLLLIQIPLAALIFRWWNVLKTIDRVDSNFIPVAANVALAATILCAWIGYMDYALYAACACAVMFILVALKLRGDEFLEVSMYIHLKMLQDEGTEILLDSGVDPNSSMARNSDGLTPLAVAAKEGDADKCELLLSYGADPNAKDNGGSTPLHQAADCVKKAAGTVCQVLLTHGADPNAKDGGGETPLHEAACMGEEEVCQLLLSHGANPNVKNEDGETPLHEAACMGEEEVCQLLLSHGADPNAKDGGGETPLHRAAYKGEEEVCQLLLSHGADPNAKDGGGETPLHKAASTGEEEVCKLLLTKGAELNAKDEGGRPPLWVAAMSGKPEVFKLLLRRGATLERGMLLLAAKGASVEICKICLAHGDDTNMRSDKGVTPLHVLFVYGRKKELELCCRLLLDHDANPNAKTTDVFEDISAGSTPLHLVAEKLNEALRDFNEKKEEMWRSVYNMLLSAGGNPNLANADRLTPDMIVKGKSAPQKSSQK